MRYRYLDRGINTLWWFVLALMVVLSVYLVVGRLLTSQITDYRMSLEHLISAETNLDVNIEEIEGDWSFFSPIFRVRGMSLKWPKSAADEFISIASIEVKLDLASSLLNQVPVFNALDVAGVVLDLEQGSKGQWRLLGLPEVVDDKAGNADDDSNDSVSSVLNTILEAFDKGVSIALLQEKITFVGLHLRLTSKELETKTFSFNQISLEKYLNESLIKGRFIVNDDPSQKGSWVISVNGSPTKEDFSAKGYLSLVETDWSSLIPFFNSQKQLLHTQFGAQAWFEVKHNKVQDIFVDLKAQHIAWQLKFPHDIQDARLIFATQYLDNDWILNVRSSTVLLDGKSWRFPNLKAVVDSNLSRVDVYLKALDLEPFIQNVRQGVGWPDSLEPYLQSLQPKGVLEHAQLTLFLKDFDVEDLQLTAQFEDLAVKPWSGAPGISSINAQLKMTLSGGEVLFQGKNSRMNFPNLYVSPFELDRLRGRVRYKVIPNHVTVWGDSLLMEHSLVESLKATFDLYLSDNNQESPSTFSLNLGFDQADIKAHKLFVPAKVVSQGLVDWLESSLISGKVASGQVFYYGPIDTDQSASQVEVFLEAESLELRYLQDWPSIRNAHANIWVKNDQVEALIDQAETLGGTLSRAKVVYPSRQRDALDVDLKLVGSLSEAFQYLTATPLSETVDNAFDSWKVNGQHESELELYVPFEKEQDVEVNLDMKLLSAGLDLTEQALDFRKLNGRLTYTSARGVSSDALTAELFNEPVKAWINTQVFDQGEITDINFQGLAKVQDVKEYVKLNLLNPLEGKVKVEGRYQLDSRPGRHSSLTVNSDLVGLISHWPSPFNKVEDTPKDFQLEMKFKAETEILISYSSQLQLALALDDQGLNRGQIFLGKSAAYLPAEKGLHLLGHVEEVQLDVWQEFFSKGMQSSIQSSIHERKLTTGNSADSSYVPFKQAHNNTAKTSSRSGASRAMEALSIIRQADVSVERLNYKDKTFKRFRIRMKPDDAGLHIVVESPLIRGTASLSKNLREPYNLSLDYLHWPYVDHLEQEASSNSTLHPEGLKSSQENPAIDVKRLLANDPLKAFDPSWLPDFNLNVQEVFIGTDNLGRWDIESRQEEQRLRVDIKDAFIKRARLTGRLYWYGGQHPRTELPVLKIETKDFGDLQRAWRQTAALEAKKSKAQMSFSWLGSPMMFNKETLAGDVNFELNRVNAQLETQAAEGVKLFGIADIRALGRRFQGDFSDVIDPGLEFDRIFGRVEIKDQFIRIKGTIKAVGTILKGEMNGELNLRNLHIDADLLGTLSLTSQIPIFAAILGINPPVAISLFITEQLTGRQLERLASFVYKVEGPVNNPKITLNRAFNNQIKGKDEPWYQKLLRSNSEGKSVKSIEKTKPKGNTRGGR